MCTASLFVSFTALNWVVNYEDTSLQIRCDRISGTFDLYTLLIITLIFTGLVFKKGWYLWYTNQVCCTALWVTVALLSLSTDTSTWNCCLFILLCIWLWGEEHQLILMLLLINLTIKNGGMFTSSSARLGSQSHYSTSRLISVHVSNI